MKKIFGIIIIGFTSSLSAQSIDPYDDCGNLKSSEQLFEEAIAIQKEKIRLEEEARLKREAEEKQRQWDEAKAKQKELISNLFHGPRNQALQVVTDLHALEEKFPGISSDQTKFLIGYLTYNLTMESDTTLEAKSEVLRLLEDYEKNSKDTSVVPVAYQAYLNLNGKDAMHSQYNRVYAAEFENILKKRPDVGIATAAQSKNPEYLIQDLAYVANPNDLQPLLDQLKNSESAKIRDSAKYTEMLMLSHQMNKAALRLEKAMKDGTPVDADLSDKFRAALKAYAGLEFETDAGSTMKTQIDKLIAQDGLYERFVFKYPRQMPETFKNFFTPLLPEIHAAALNSDYKAYAFAGLLGNIGDPSSISTLQSIRGNGGSAREFADGAIRRIRGEK